NVGVQINHISPINKGEIVWTIGAEELIFIGRLIETGKVDLTRTIAVAGTEVKEPSYYKAIVGMSLKTLLEGKLCHSQHIRIINGNPLVGKVAGISQYLSARATEVTVIPEGDDNNEVLGWIMPRLNDFSKNRSYFSWLQGRKKYNLDARIKGGERHIIMSGEYDRVLPMDIYAGYLIKAILTADLDRMEMLGIYEVAPEDFAVAEFVDSSKLELQRIVREGLDLLRKELE
ncbi:MAG: NADH:ubiquinone reductase (Na(+)-transporting) subunit A, partial [Bacteroidaceae bacterium]